MILESLATIHLFLHHRVNLLQVGIVHLDVKVKEFHPFAQVSFSLLAQP